MATTTEYTFTLSPCSTGRLRINAACINANRPIPGEKDRFYVPYEKKAQDYENGTYIGEFRHGEQHGRGNYTWKNGKSYEGEWKNGNSRGEGTFTFEDRGNT